MNIVKQFELNSRFIPEKTALICEDDVYSYKKLNMLSANIAGSLIKIGVKKGDRVALYLPNIPEFAISYIGIQKIGAISVSINSQNKMKAVEYILQNSDAKIIITTDSLIKEIPTDYLINLKKIVVVGNENKSYPGFKEFLNESTALLHSSEMDRNDPAAIIYTSGTTGFPKGVTLSHKNVISNSYIHEYQMNLNKNDKLLLYVPIHHSFGQNSIFNCALNAGATVVMVNGFNPDNIIKTIQKNEVSMFFGAPTSYISLLDKVSKEKMKSVRYYFCAASILPHKIEKNWLEKFGVPIHQGYGLTETSPCASYNHRTFYKFGSIGTPVQNVDIKVVNVTDGKRVKVCEQGEILVKGPNVMLGYWNDPKSTQKTIKDGWLHTGDIGYMDEDGFFFITDRIKDMIIVGGLNVYPAEVEKVICSISAVLESAVYGVSESLLGEAVVACIVVKKDMKLTEQEILKHCKDNIAEYKVPSFIKFVNELPKSNTGKVLKRVLRDGKDISFDNIEVQDKLILSNKESSLEFNESEIEQWILNWLNCNLDEVNSFDYNKSLIEYGLSSLKAVSMADALSQWLKKDIEAVVLWNYPSINKLIDFVKEITKKKDKVDTSYYIPINNQIDVETSQPVLWPSIAEFFIYDELLYNILAGDQYRNERYEAAINKLVKDKVVLEIGPGKEAILSRLCIKAGAKKVYAVEIGEEAFNKASAKLNELNLTDKIKLIKSDISNVSLPEKADVCISEIVGAIGGSEGAALLINRVRPLLKDDGVMIPEKSITKIAAIQLPDEVFNNPEFSKLSGYYTKEIFDQVGYPFDLRLCIKNFPKENILSNYQVFESLNFTRHMEPEYSIKNTFFIKKNARLDGFLVWLNLHTIEGEVIDILENDNSWIPVFIPAFYPGIEVFKGDRIESFTEAKLCDNKLNPDYHIHGHLICKNSSPKQFDYTSYHYKQSFKNSPFYEKVFSKPLDKQNDSSLGEIGESNNTDPDVSDVSDLDLMEMLANEIDESKKRRS